MKESRMNVVYGGQAGSEAKGKQAAYLASKYNIRVFAANMSPNAGHTVVKLGDKIVTHHIPVGVAGSTSPNPIVILGPASVINVDLLEEEVGRLVEMEVIESPSQIFVDERACLITAGNIAEETRTMVSMGSTAQGVGEARASMVMRRNSRVEHARDVFHSMGVNVVKKTDEMVIDLMDSGSTVLYEMGQGFDLCLFHGVDPFYCTSRNCTPAQAFADMGVPIKYAGDSYAVIRPYPIRVNNRTGSSGPYPSMEIVWNEVKKRCGAPYSIAELTTTTKLERRVFEFSMEQFKRMVKVCDPSYICLQFGNYLDWDLFNHVTEFGWSKIVRDFISAIHKETGKTVAYIGTGPEHNAMIDTKADKWVEGK